MSKEELKNCPCCNSKRVRVLRGTYDEKYNYRVYCADCQLRTFAESTKKKAIAIWSRRAIEKSLESCYESRVIYSKELEAENAELKQRLAEVENQWVSVEDRLPEDSNPVLILTSYGSQATAYRGSGSYFGWFDLMRPQHTYGSVTHWMPLPSTKQITGDL